MPGVGVGGVSGVGGVGGVDAVGGVGGMGAYLGRVEPVEAAAILQSCFSSTILEIYYCSPWSSRAG